jgi:peroxiredoxin
VTFLKSALLGALAALPLAAQQEPLPGHSLHGETFNEGPRQAARVMGGMGNCSLPVTARDARLQELFNQGVGQLHGFYYFEAERSFRQVAAADPDCAMAYWGMAMANVNNEKRAKGFLERAEKLKDKASKRERMWIKVLSDYYKIASSEKEKRARSYIKSLEAILHEHPGETEAKAFLAWALWHHKDKGLPLQSHQAVDALIEDVLRANPMHNGAHHYRIHLWDDEKAARALSSVPLFGPSSPGIAHAWHMPGHTLSKLHRYAEAAHQQEASARVDHLQMRLDSTMPYQIHNYAHNNQWLAQDLAYVGRARDAVAVAENLIEIPRHPKLNRVQDGGSCARSGRHRLIETLARWELWDELLSRAETTLAKIDNAEDSAERARALAAAHAAAGRTEKIRALLGELDPLAKAEPAKPDEEKAETDEKKREEARQARENKSKAVRNAIDELSGRVKLAAGEFKEAIELFKKAESSKALLARACLAAGEKDQAEKTAKSAVDAAPGQLHPRAVRVEILLALEKKEEAAKAARDMMELAGEADPGLPILERLRPFLAEEKLAPAARKKPAMDLEALGPLCWKPAPAAAFALEDADGNACSLPGAAEGPLLVLFYLGSKCTHCVEQLQAFSKLAEEFGKLGVRTVAVSAESQEELRKNREAGKGAYPFPLLSDPELKVFKRYRCYDDFEKIPLHGTFLVESKEGAGRIRWQEISFTPFADAKFLLEECRRLLSIVR